MKIYRKTALEDWDNRAEHLVAEMPRAEAASWLAQHPDPDLVSLTNEQEAHWGQEPEIKPLPDMLCQVVPSRDFIAVYHGSTSGNPARLIPNRPGALLDVVAWYMARSVVPFIH